MNKNDFNHCLWDNFTVDIKPYLSLYLNIYLRMSIQENDKFLSEDYFYLTLDYCRFELDCLLEVELIKKENINE